MWSLTSDDIQRAIDRARQRRVEVEERYAEELKTIETECTQLEALQRIGAEFSQKHNSQEPEPAAAFSQPEAAASEEPPAADESPENGSDRRPSSRWRFQLSHREDEPHSEAS